MAPTNFDTFAALRLAEQLIACRSVTPHDAGCQDILIARLAPLGFVIETIVSGPETFRVTNLWTKRQFTHGGIDSIAINSIAKIIPLPGDRCEVVVADIENGPYPLVGQTFNAVVVTNYLWRPLFPLICGNVADGGVLIYETFAAGNETVGKPSRPDFLLQPGELLQVCVQGGLRVVAYEDGFLDVPARFVQRVVAVRDVAGSGMRAKRLALRIP